MVRKYLACYVLAWDTQQKSRMHKAMKQIPIKKTSQIPGEFPRAADTTFEEKHP